MISCPCEPGSAKCEVEAMRTKDTKELCRRAMTIRMRKNADSTCRLCTGIRHRRLRTSTFVILAKYFVTSHFELVRTSSFALRWCVTLRADAYVETDHRIQRNPLSGLAGAEAGENGSGLASGSSGRLLWREDRPGRIGAHRRRRSRAGTGRSFARGEEATPPSRFRPR